MKKIILISSLLLSFNTSFAVAGWNSTTVNTIQMPSDNTIVYINLNDYVAADGCPSAVQVKNLIIDQSMGNFDQLYAQLMIAKQTNSQISVLSSRGTCNDTYIVGPYLRFD